MMQSAPPCTAASSCAPSPKKRLSIGRPSSARPDAASGEGSMPRPCHPRARVAKSSPKPKPQPISVYAAPSGSLTRARVRTIGHNPAPAST